jgi:TRAP-type C4-dicarboxylate transport system permease large subunit
MKKSGMPAHLAANIEAATSTLGNQIPPSGIIVLSFGALGAYYTSIGQDNPYTMANFWIVLWGISLWFLLHRFVMTYIFIRYYKVSPMPASEIPNLKESIKHGWKALLLPLVIFLPFILDANLGAFFTSRIGPARGAISGNILQFAPGLAAIYACIIARKIAKVGPATMAAAFTKSIKSIVPITATIFFAYCLAALFADVGLGPAVKTYFEGLGLNFVLLAFMLPLFTAIVGMVIPGSSQVAIFGSAIVGIMVASGGHPLLIAAMLPAITGAMEGMTPPIALCTYTAMGIAQSGFKETVVNSLYWIGIHYLLSVICILGILPIIGFF